MREKLHPTLIELWIGIVLWSILISGIGVWFCKDKPAWFIGIAFGALAAFGLAFYMKQSVDRLVDDLESGRGDKVIRASSMIRLFIAAAAIAIACFVPLMNPIGTFLGILSMKFAAYSNPLIHGVTKKIHPYFADKEYPPEEEETEPEAEAEAETIEEAEVEAKVEAEAETQEETIAEGVENTETEDNTDTSETAEEQI